MQPASVGHGRVGLKLAVIGLLAAGLCVQGSRRAAAVTVVSDVRIERTAPVVVTRLSELDILPLGSSSERLASIPLVVKVSGETGDSQTVSLTSNSAGVARFELTPMFPGPINIEAFNDINLNGLRDVGERFSVLDTIAVLPHNNLRSSLTGSGQVDFRGLFPDAMSPVLGTFSVNLKTSAAGKPSGKFSFSIPDRQISGSSTGIEAFVGATYTSKIKGAYALGTLRIGSMTRWFGLNAVDESGAGADEFHLSLYNAPNEPAFSGGGDLIPRSGLKNDLSYKIGTGVDLKALELWPRNVDYGTVHPQQFYTKPIYFVNTSTNPVMARLDTSHLEITYFNFFPAASEFSIQPWQYYKLNSIFSSRRACTHRGYLKVISQDLGGGSFNLPYSVASRF